MRKDTGKRHKYPKPAKAVARQNIEKVRPTTVTLTMRHYINGQAYGPGEVRVPGAVAHSLLEQETRARHSEELFHARRAGVITRGGRRVSIPYNEFDEVWANARPLETIGG